MWRSIIKNQRGQAMVEMALLLPIIILLIFGMIQFGLIYTNQLTLANAVREGARFAAAGPFSDTTPNVETGTSTPVKTEIVNRVLNYAPGLTTANMTVRVQFQGSSSSTPNTSDARTPSNPVQVNATYPVTENIPFMPLWTLNLHSTAIMRVES